MRSKLLHLSIMLKFVSKVVFFLALVFPLLSVAMGQAADPHFPGFPCQQQAAAFHNKANIAIAAGTAALVGLRMLQANAAYYGAITELKFWGFISSLTLPMFLFAPTVYHLVFVPVVLFPIAIQLGNIYRNRQTKHLCSTYFEINFNQELAKAILAIAYDSYKDLPKLIILFNPYTNVDISPLNDYVPSQFALEDDS